MTTPATHSADSDPLASALEHAAHVLPAQGPIGVFVHHNTLHAFEDRPFERAVVDAARIFGAEPFMPATWFRARLHEGRITMADLDAILDDMPNGDDPMLGGRVSRRALRRQLLVPGLVDADGASIGWMLEEGGLGQRFVEGIAAAKRAAIVAETTRFLAERLRSGVDAAVLFGDPSDPVDPADLVRRRLGTRADVRGLEDALERAPEACTIAALWSATVRRTADVHVSSPRRTTVLGATRMRDDLLRAGARDADDLVHAVLVPGLSAFLDQGVAYWPMGDRELGFYAAFRKLVLDGAPVPIPLLTDARAILRDEAARGLDAESSVRASLARLGVAPRDYAAHLTAVCLALPGWTGLLRKLELEPGLAPYRCPPCRLVDLLAVRLVLDEVAARRIAEEDLDLVADAAGLARRLAARTSRPDDDSARAAAFACFQVAQLCGVSAPAMREMAQDDLDELFAELTVFDDLERRRVFHLAYERRHRLDVLPAIARHRRSIDPGRLRSPAPRIQVAFCLDEREESLRRHLEEQDPRIETFGVAGFFGLAIAYRGLDDAHHAPLCPVVQQPTHSIRELGLDEMLARRYEARRKLWSSLSFGNFFGSRALVRGWLATLGFGVLSMLPLALRVLVPGPVTRLAARLRPWLLPRPPTQLAMHRASDPMPDPARHAGFTAAEMADRVAQLLEDMGLVRGWAPLVAMVGHGSASLNNPHESAHDCGACGGRRGIPNGRLFAAMANDSDVREILRQRGLEIPSGTVFVGGYHDTCNDDVRFFDVDAIPASHRGHFEHLRATLDRARMLDAHERCRRFESVPLDVTPEAALLHVQGRAEDLAQPRPEYGHATNAVCVFGRRSLTRGLFLDRRAFLVSYDPTLDPDAVTLGRLLAAMGPVGAGISLEYYFSFVDNERYGCGTKLPHNIAGLMGVINGHVSDLRTGLPWQMVEIHEPVRLLVIVEATAEAFAAVVAAHPEVGALARRGWIQLALIDPVTGDMTEFQAGAFVPVAAAAQPLPVVARSREWYAGRRGHLPIAVVTDGLARFTRGAGR